MQRFLTLFSMIMVGSALGILSVAAQTDEQGIEPEIQWECPGGFEGQTLHVYNWATYIGETTIVDFEELCDVDIVYDVYDSNESLIARLRQGNPGYDVAFPSDYAVAIMIRDGLIESINPDHIPNLSNIAERWRGLYFDPENEYSVPYLWGSLGVAYNTLRVREEITSWQQIFDHNGPVAWIDDSRSMLGIGLKMLGYDPNSTDADEIAEARDFLIENSGSAVSTAEDDGQALLARGEVDIAIEYSGDVYQVMADCECDDYAYVVPDEGSITFIDLMVVLKDAPNPELAEAFIDYILDPAVNAMIVNDTLYPTPNQAAIESGWISEELLNNPAVFPDEESLGNLFFLQDVGEAEQYYNDAWDEIVISIGD